MRSSTAGAVGWDAEEEVGLRENGGGYSGDIMSGGIWCVADGSDPSTKKAAWVVSNWLLILSLALSSSVSGVGEGGDKIGLGGTRSTSKMGGCWDGHSSCSQNVARTAFTGDVRSIVIGALKERPKLGFTMSVETFDQSTGHVPFTLKAVLIFSEDRPSM